LGGIRTHGFQTKYDLNVLLTAVIDVTTFLNRLTIYILEVADSRGMNTELGEIRGLQSDQTMRKNRQYAGDGEGP
jgi:hypothetical protein